MKSRNVACVLISKHITEEFVECFCLFIVSCCLSSFNVQISNSSFRLQFAIDIAENSFRVPFSLFCQGAFKSLICLTTLPACLFPSLSIFLIVLHVHRVPVTVICLVLRFDLYQGCVIHPHGSVPSVMWILVTVRLGYALIHGRCYSFFQVSPTFFHWHIIYHTQVALSDESS